MTLHEKLDALLNNSININGLDSIYTVNLGTSDYTLSEDYSLAILIQNRGYGEYYINYTGSGNLVYDAEKEYHTTVGHMGSVMAYVSKAKAGDKFSSKLQNVNVDLILIK